MHSLAILPEKSNTHGYLDGNLLSQSTNLFVEIAMQAPFGEMRQEIMLKATKTAGCCVDPSKTNLRSVVCHVMMLARPLVCSVAIASLWRYVFFEYEINLGKSDETALTNMVIPICAMFHSILAAMVLGKVWEEFKVVRHCLLEKDRERFQVCMHERIPGMIHLLLGTMSLIIISGIMLIEYSNPWSGIAAVGAVTFFLVLYWEVATTLDNPTKSPWFVGKIPLEWLIEGQRTETKLPASRTTELERAAR